MIKADHFGHVQTWQISVLNCSKLLRKGRLRKLRRPSCLTNLLGGIKSCISIHTADIWPIQHILIKQIIGTLSIIANILHDFILNETYEFLFHLLLIFVSYSHFFNLHLQLYDRCFLLADYSIFLAHYIIY